MIWNSERAADAFGLVGQTIDRRFLIERHVADGGFGVVYRARQLVLGRTVALKVLKPASSVGADRSMNVFEAFADEAQIIARLQHPHIVEVYDFGEAPTRSGEVVHWMALEWLEGRTLESFLDERRKSGQPAMGRSEAMRLMRPVFEAIAFAHDNGVVHRDLKPGNVFLVERQGGLFPKVLDFGIAKMVVGDETTSLQTTRGSSGFSPDYAAPEQISYGRTGPHTDVHALGLMLGELLTGHPPYAGEPQRLEAVMREQRPTPAAKGVSVGNWEPVLARAIALRPRDRYPNADAFLRALEDPAGEVGVSLKGQAASTFLSRSGKPEARDAYLRGRYLFDKGRGPEALQHIEEATRMDPEYAPAFAALAAFHLWHGFAGVRVDDIRAQAVPAAIRAVELDPDLADAQVAMGAALWLCEGDWAGGARHFLRALSLNPSNAIAHLLYGQQCVATQRFAEATTHSMRALELEPVSQFIGSAVTRTYFYAGRFDVLVKHLTSVWQIGREHGATNRGLCRDLAMAYLEQGLAFEASRELEKAADDSAEYLELWGRVQARSGAMEGALSALRRLEALAHQRYVPAVNIARLQCAVGHLDGALVSLDRAYQGREFDLLFLRVDPRFDSALRATPAFATLIRRIGIPEPPAPTTLA